MIDATSEGVIRLSISPLSGKEGTQVKEPGGAGTGPSYTRGMRKIILAAALLALSMPAISDSAPALRSRSVSAYSNYFTPSAITVVRGTKVTWVVRQGAHNVMGRGFSSPILAKGRTYSKKFKRGGTYRYVCTLHPGMAGKVVVR